MVMVAIEVVALGGWAACGRSSIRIIAEVSGGYVLAVMFRWRPDSGGGMDSLKEIAEQLGKVDWDFNLNPCDGNSNWSTPYRDGRKYYLNNVYCTCSNADGVCHVTVLKAQDLPGTLPPSLAKLTFIKMIVFIATNLTGGLPLELNKLTRLRELRISDLNGEDSEFPVLSNMTGMNKLMLRSCNISGKIPDYIADMTALNTLDLSFNKLEGEIPNLGGLGRLKILRTTIGNTIYEADQDTAGSARFVPSRTNWGTSSTGDFWGRSATLDYYTANNISVLRMNDSELYTTAQLSPLSLTYYARCLANGNYT
ncbi:hypothetical protein RJ640_031021, partial [Escallonia rubra]